MREVITTETEKAVSAEVDVPSRLRKAFRRGGIVVGTVLGLSLAGAALEGADSFNHDIPSINLTLEGDGEFNAGEIPRNVLLAGGGLLLLTVASAMTVASGDEERAIRTGLG